MPINGTPGGAMQAMQSGAQGEQQPGMDANKDPYNLQDVAQMAGAQQQQMN